MNWKGGKTSKRCEVCLETYETYKEAQRFCSKPCAGLDRSINEYPGKFGPAHKNWKGGISKNKSYLSWLKNKRNRIFYKFSVKHTFEEWEQLKVRYSYSCLACLRREPEIKLTKDHIIPVSKGGQDYIENIQPLCISCNSRKGAKSINYTNQ